VRNYKRKGKTPWPDKDKRMAAAVRKRAEGKSNRQIAKELAVDERTVRRDLARWEALNPTNVLPLVRQKGAATRPAGGNLPQQNAAPDGSAPKLRRIQ
jgi:hypothetical protein